MVREDVEDFFAPFARIRARRMFSGYGAYIDDACFALVIRGAIWIKTDEESERGALTAAGSEPFNYTRPDGRHVVMSAFWRLPDAALDDEDALRRWCAPALAAAQRTAAEKARKATKAALPGRTGKKTGKAR